MKSILYKIVYFFTIAVLFSSCGTTKIIADNNEVDIYIDGSKKGKGSVEIRRMGVPKKIDVVAKFRTKEVGTLQLKRKFDFVTFLTGYFSYGMGFIFGWRFPEMVTIPTKSIDETKKTKSIWDEPPGSGNW
ncbi:MAG: hypothetical protein HN704_15735 [Bacteroidetes bacterium]|jgi:hypothetical protein|nr:hypothetical protein [Bacteroidota bacterium]MBT6685690.1 hypothetical protein [Bacteroidota bacterium]MBT7141914.1 hypothetical protein [Bacteroidota bacterium]MBT7493048.1 hypothetical protein [Bacteroidota bacterium]